ncbi:MAG: DUF4920 domain-containing protein [Flavobacteriales bacterium]|nr:DUF4920 domain-containing protein [Flavobacteriales bacterium]
MNKFLSLLAGGVFALACQTSSNEATAQVPGFASYGAAITPDGAVSTAEMVKKLGAQDSMVVKVTGEIVTTCIKKGCWMDVKLPDGKTMKVRFVDYGFFVPTEGQEGKTCVMQGQVSREEIPVALLKHYAEDAGRTKEEIDAIKEPEVSLTFLAEGVLIKQ